MGTAPHPFKSPGTGEKGVLELPHVDGEGPTAALAVLSVYLEFEVPWVETHVPGPSVPAHRPVASIPAPSSGETLMEAPLAVVPTARRGPAKKLGVSGTEAQTHDTRARRRVQGRCVGW